MDSKRCVTAAYYTLGCKLNYAESSTIGKMLSDRGVVRVSEGETPDVCVVNTCSVTETADKKGRQLIKRLNRNYPGAIIVVTGCYAQLKPGEVSSLPGVDIVVGSNDKLRIAQYLDSFLKHRQSVVDVSDVSHGAGFMPSCERGDRTRFFLKVQDGCDYFCTYCTIPYARGRSRSGSVGQIVRQAEEAAAAGGKEIVLTGVNIGDFGHGTGKDLFSLIRELDKVPGVERYRISSIEPNLLTEEIVRWVAVESQKFMPHFHIPLQSGSDRVLKLMNRRYDTALFRSRIDMIRSLLPDAFIGIDIMTGARGEDEAEWEKSYRFVESLPITRMHVFPYSERPGTAALRMAGAVDNAVKHRRVAMLARLSETKLRDFAMHAVGSLHPVLWENIHRGDVMHGLTDNYLRVEAAADRRLLNTVTNVRLTGIVNDNPELMTGRIED